MSNGRGSNRREQPGGWGDSLTLWLGIGGVVALLAGVYAAVHVGHRWAGLAEPAGDPWVVLFGVLDGSVAWPTEATWVGAGLAALAALGSGLITLLVSRSKSKRTRLDWTAGVLGRGKEISGISAKEASRKAAAWGVVADSPGIPLGHTLNTRQALYASYEDVMTLIAGPRTGKTLCYAIPAIVSAPGAVIATSNKRDLVDATREVRETNSKVWVFDPQNIAGEEPTWWWNPLSYVTDEVKAATLADHFAAGSRAADAKTDAFFEPAGRDLLAGLLLAAALADRPITDVYRWLTRPADDSAVAILNERGFPLTADQVAGVIDSPDKQRGGVYGTAQQMASCLTNRAVLRWITEEGFTRRPHFDPHSFVAGSETLYSLSKEGRGNAGPLVTALTVAVIEAAEELAKTHPGGRLQTPMVGVLDEAANVCRWRDLPDLYSHYGSRGIVLLTILQSWSQGEEVWGRAGINKLWSASNTAVYAGGVKEEEFLERLSKLIGTYDKETRSISARAGAGMFGGGTQTSRQLSRERIVDVDDLAALPRGRAIVLSSGNRATIVVPQPWTQGPHADAIHASRAIHDPQVRTVGAQQ